MHPALVHFPVVCWTVAPLTDGLYAFLRVPVWWQISWWLLATGSLTGLAAMIAGTLDLFAIPARHPAQPVAQRHMLLMGSAWCILLPDWLLRPSSGMPDALIMWCGLTLSVAGWLITVVGAYSGAQLVYRYGIGQTAQHDSP